MRGFLVQLQLFLVLVLSFPGTVAGQGVKPFDPPVSQLQPITHDVDLELVLAVDVSGSMDDEEHQVQRHGYVAAFRHVDVHRAIAGGARKRIGIVYFEWAGTSSQIITVDWTLVHDAASAVAFAEKLATAPRAPIRGTSISGGLMFAATLFGKVFRGERRVVDISGDGPNSRGPPVEPVRDELVKRGIVINGLPLVIRPTFSPYVSDGGLSSYYKDCVIGGPGAFVIPVTEMGQFAEAVRRKLIIEIAGLEVLVHKVQEGPRTMSQGDCLTGTAGRGNRGDW